MKERESGTKYQETKQHGSRLFPFNIYPCTIPLDFPAVPLHWHKEMELIYIKKGKGLIQTRNRKAYEGRTGGYFCGDSWNPSCHSQNKRIFYGIRKYYL